MKTWQFCPLCKAVDAEYICRECLGCDNCCTDQGRLFHRTSAEGSMLRRLARQKTEKASHT